MVLFKDKCLEEPLGEGMCLLAVALEHELVEAHQL